MFDPTAFDNLKVVLEGTVYDGDLTGEITIIDRKDLFDFASYERRYSIEFRVPTISSVAVTIVLKANMNHFLAERRKDTNRIEAGAELEIVYKGEDNLLQKKGPLMVAWGSEKQWEWRQVLSSVNGNSTEARMQFQRLITEEMVDDLLDIVSFTIQTISDFET